MGYSFDNIRLVTLRENISAGNTEGAAAGAAGVAGAAAGAAAWAAAGDAAGAAAWAAARAAGVAMKKKIIEYGVELLGEENGSRNN